MLKRICKIKFLQVLFLYEKKYIYIKFEKYIKF